MNYSTLRWGMLHTLLTRQGAEAFNQPLTFDTSQATAMEFMFTVRSTLALPPNATSSPPPPPPSPCMPLVGRLCPYPVPCLFSRLRH